MLLFIPKSPNPSLASPYSLGESYLKRSKQYPSRLLLRLLLCSFLLVSVYCKLTDTVSYSFPVDNDCDELIHSETSTAHMEARHATLRACHKGKATTAEKGKGKSVDVTPSDLTLAARLPSVDVVIRAIPTAVALAAAH
nr:hypothetical protein Iba_chr11aCG13940 [Ipomoea batatas]